MHSVLTISDDVQFLCTFPSIFTVKLKYEHLTIETELPQSPWPVF